MPDVLTKEAPKKLDGVAELIRTLKQAEEEAVALADLPLEVRTLDTLLTALEQGKIEFGRRDYTTSKDPKIDDGVHLHVGNEWSWTDLRGRNRKKLAGVLKEEEAFGAVRFTNDLDGSKKKRIRLCVRLANGPLGMSA